jgi:hypothetical protein
MSKSILGHINCPYCGEDAGMEIKHDKNLEPFGYCPYCAGQMRVGGKPGRVRAFCKMYPWASNPPVTAVNPVTVTVTGEKAPPVAAPSPVPVAPRMAPPKRTATFADALGMLGVASKAAA